MRNTVASTCAATFYGVAAVLLTSCTSPIGAGGAITLPAGGPLLQLPPAASVAITPAPFPTAVGTAGVAVLVTVRSAGGTTVPNVPVVIELGTGRDGAQNSLVEIGVNPASGRPFVATKVTTATDNTTGTLSFTLKATTSGDEDVMTVTVDPGPRQNAQTFRYATTNP